MGSTQSGPNPRINGGGAAKSRRSSTSGRGTVVATGRGKEPNAGARGQAIVQSPRLSFAEVMQPGHLVGGSWWAARSCGALMISGAIAGVLGQTLSFATYGGVRITAQLTVLSVLAIAIKFAAFAGAGVGLIAGRGLRACIAICWVAATISIGELLTVIYQGSSAPHHATEEFLFGQKFQTTQVIVDSGYWFALIAAISLIIAGTLAVAAWFGVDEVESIPLDGARAGTAFAAGAAGVFGVIALLNPPFLPAVRTYLPSGSLLAQVVDVTVPPGPFDAIGLLEVAGILTALGVGVAGFLVAIVNSRRGVIGGLTGLGAYFAWSTLNGVHDAMINADLVLGVRFYLSLTATVICAGGVWFAWVARRRRSGPLREETAEI